MARLLLILPLRLIQSVLGQKAEAKPVDPIHRERSQSRAVMRGCEVACLPSRAGSPLGRSRERASPFLAKFDQSASFWTGLGTAYAVSGVPTAPVLQAITSSQRKAHLTDEVPRCPGSKGRVGSGYKPHAKGPPYAPATGTASPRPRPQGYQQRQSRCSGPRLGIERQNLRVLSGSRKFMGSVSSAIEVSKWPGGTSSLQPVDWLRNSPQQPPGLRQRFVYQ